MSRRAERYMDAYGNPRVRVYSKHAIAGGEYTTLGGITYSISPQGPNTKHYRDRVHCMDNDPSGQTCDAPYWRRDNV